MTSESSLRNTLPTLDRLDATIPPDLDVNAVAQSWLDQFSGAITAGNVPAILAIIHPDGYWRDLFALTWDLRTFHGSEHIQQFLSDRLNVTQLSVPAQFTGATLSKWYDDLQWIVVQFSFETPVANGSAVSYLVPTKSGAWKAFIISTNLESLKGHPEQLGQLRSFDPVHGNWEEQRRREQAFEDRNPEVVIVGAGHSGLDLAARLKVLGVSALVVEKNPRVGDQWRGRYEALCLHDVVWANHLPYLSFPPNFPVYIPAKKLADWLESYAKIMELNIWNSSLVTRARRDDTTGKWSVTVRKGDGTERILHADHVVFALGWGGDAKVPNIPGKEDFQGQVLHSSQHHSAKDHLGKKVVVLGACTSAHDVAADYANHGVDVTIFQRSSTYIMTTKEGMPRLVGSLFWEGGPPTEVADRLANSIPISISKLVGVRQVLDIQKADQKLLDGLHAVGYRTNLGVDDSGIYYSALTRGGGYYLDVGACQLIIDGKIKIKNNSQVERFTRTGLKLADGSELEADVVLYATGYGDQRDLIRRVVGNEIADKIPKIWGLNGEGELSGTWRELGVPGLWYMMGNLAWSRFFSKHTALQIKAKQVGLFGERYSAPFVY